ncbi:glycoside hydrolase family 28 protein [Niabella aquatica]
MMHFKTTFLSVIISVLLFSKINASGLIIDKKDSVPVKAQVGAAALPEGIAPITAPFTMPQLQKPVFPARSISIVSHGAKEGAKVTQAIQQSIDQVHQQGGGTVIIPKGKWHTGRISLLSNVNVEIAEGAELYFSGEVEDYRPAVFTRNEGIEVMSLGACIYANGQRNIAVTGKGKLIGPAKGGSVRKQIMTQDVIENVVSYKTPVAERVYEGHNGDIIFPPMFISPINCSNVLIEGISLENTAFWNIVPVYCDSVIIRGVTVHSVGIPRGDGIDIESSKNVLIEYCTLSTGDDAFTIKAGRGDDGLRVNQPTENVVVRHCLVVEGHGGITCGSETAAMIRNLYVHDCVFQDARSAIRFKTRRPRGGGGAQLYYERIRISGSKYAIEWDMLGSAQHVGDMASRYPPRETDHLTPVFRDIKMNNIIVESADQFIKATAIPESPLSNVWIENVSSTTHKLIAAADVDGLTIKNARFISDSADIRLLDTRNIRFEHVRFMNSQNKIHTDISGPLSANIKFIQTRPKVRSNFKKQASQ